MPADGSSLDALLARSSSDPWVLAATLGLAFFLGAAHALTPGHGKTVVAAYLIGSRGRILDAVYLGALVTFTHTISVFVLGLGALYASTRVPLDRLFPYLSLFSGAMVAAIGVWLLYQRLRAADGEHAQEHHHHHPHGQPPDHAHARSSKGSLLALGVSGGLVPCPEALAVLMLSISLHRLVLGLALLGAFTAGLAVILIGIGCAMVVAGPKIEGLTRGSRWTRLLPVTSAAVVTLLGVLMITEAAREF